MNTILLFARLARLILHIIEGMLTLALVFPWADTQRRNDTIQAWSRRLLRICRVQVELMPGAVPLQHALIVCNHVSWLDIFVINSQFPCRFVAKSEIRAWPLLGWLVAKAGTVFLARGSRRDLRQIFKGLVENLQLGERVAFFPEGTTAAQGQLLPFHANLFEAAIDAGVFVQPYAVRYVDAAGALMPEVEFIGETTFAASICTILGGRRARAQLTLLAPLDADDAHRRELCAAAHAAIGAALKSL